MRGFAIDRRGKASRNQPTGAAGLLLMVMLLLLAACTETTENPVPETPVAATSEPLAERKVPRLEDMGIKVSAEENRPVSFTNKQSAYFYTQSHRNDHEEHAWFRGLNIAQRRIFSDYEIRLGDRLLDPQTAEVRVYPDRLVRTYPDGPTETLRLYDYRDLVEIEINGANVPATVTPAGKGIELLETDEQLRSYSTMESPDKVIAAGQHGDRHFLIVADDAAAAHNLFSEAITHSDQWREQREQRLADLLHGSRFVISGDADLTGALQWLFVTTDQLVTRQSGDGIYAGLPWFNEYWGRDSFIALPGALLVTGEFETARAVLTSFAEYQDLDPNSKFYGRVPNIVRPDNLDYHTTDGTPRFMVALHDYVRYSGDESIIEELYPNISASIEGALKNWTDDNGYLTHASNETWMDARRASDKVAYSPRDTRANDIQALWHGQLLAGVYFAKALGDMDSSRRWQAIADSLAIRFESDFTSPEFAYLADRLDAEDAADFSLRPNQLYALNMISDKNMVASATHSAWENLVYPWGVSSLAASDPFFHPYHLAWEKYHKDQAYHNGTVWLWNNGIAMQRMIELGQVEPAWKLFQAMNHAVLHRGVVGGLGENTDAYPHPGQDWPRLTGTYLQAWSNTEQLRIWYQFLLGLQPDMIRHSVTLAPRLPASVGTVDFSTRVGSGSIRGVYHSEEREPAYDWVFEDIETQVVIDIPPFQLVTTRVIGGDRLSVNLDGESLHWQLFDPAGRLRESGSASPSEQRKLEEERLDQVFSDVGFADPGRAQDHPVMGQVNSDRQGI